MSTRSLVLDANILIRGALGREVRQIIADNADRVALVAPESACDEAYENLDYLINDRGLDRGIVTGVLDELLLAVRPVPEEVYAPWRSHALARIESRDADDWPILATALAIDAPIWTEDRNFFGCGVATWTTDRVGLFFAYPGS